MRKSRRDKFEQGLERFRAKSVTATGSRGWSSPGMPNLRGLGAFEDKSVLELERLYARMEIVFACVRELATSVAEAPLQLGVETDDGFEPVESHELLDLFYDSPLYDFGTMIGLMVTRLHLTGASLNFLEGFKNRDGVAEIVPMPTHLLKVRANGPKLLGYELRKKSGEPVLLPPEEVLAVKLAAPWSYHDWVAPLSTCQREVQIDKERQQLTMEVLKNKDIPGLLMLTENSPNQGQRQQLMESFSRDAGRGGQNRGRGVILPPGVSSVEAGMDVSDIDFSALSMMTETRICMAFQVPPIMIGASAGLEHATYANYAEARRSFYAETILPLWNAMASSFTSALVPEGEELTFRFCTDEIAELQEDRNEAAKTGVILYKGGLATLNEAREMAGLEPVEDEEGEERYAPQLPPAFGGGGEGDAPGDQKPPEAEKPEPEDGKRLEGKDGAIGSYPGSGKLEDALQGYFREQEKALKELVKTGDELIDLSAWDAALVAAMAPEMRALWEQQTKSTLRKLYTRAGELPRLESSFELIRPEVTQQLEKNLLKLARSVNKTTQTALENQIVGVIDAARATNTVPDLTGAVRDVFKGISEKRARVIAITESSRASHDGQTLAAAKSGMVRGLKTIVSPDACDLCQYYNANGDPTGVPVHQYQDIGSAVAGVGNYASEAPPFHPNCKCTQVEVLLDEPEPMIVKPERSWSWREQTGG